MEELGHIEELGPFEYLVPIEELGPIEELDPFQELSPIEKLRPIVWPHQRPTGFTKMIHRSTTKFPQSGLISVVKTTKR
jgi:hypothetical protein